MKSKQTVLLLYNLCFHIIIPLTARVLPERICGEISLFVSGLLLQCWRLTEMQMQ